MSTWPRMMAHRLTRDEQLAPIWRAPMVVLDNGQVTVTALPGFAISQAQRSKLEALLRARSAARLG